MLFVTPVLTHGCINTVDTTTNLSAIDPVTIKEISQIRKQRHRPRRLYANNKKYASSLTWIQR